MSELPNPTDSMDGNDYPREFGTANLEKAQDSQTEDRNFAEFGDEHTDSTGSNPKSNSEGQILSGESHVPAEMDNDDAGNEAPSESVPLKEEPVTNPLDGLEEIVNPPDNSENGELAPKEESIDDLAHIIEAILFASDEPLSIGTLKSVLDASRTFGRINPDKIISRIAALNRKYDADGSGFRIIEIAEGYQFATRKELAQWVSYLFKEKAKRKLSNSALETLAIIAYKQPITKPEVESIRGVNVDYVLHNLLEKEIVTVVGRAETVGRPLLYGTTQRFLKVFGLKNLEDLPKLREIEEIIKEIRSRGAEESIQLEITALGDQATAEPAASGDSTIKSSTTDSSINQEHEPQGNSSIDDSIAKE
jgi:segregation and condensation protein B